jgi:DNA-binding beta-propeller fold protein YncE
MGIALDKNNNIYVAGMGSNNVVVLSADGKNCKQILTKSDGLSKPWSLRINIDRNDGYLSFINNISPHRHHCQIFTTLHNIFTPILQ